jgi:small-conductance mechanosensitive channel
MVAFVVVIAYPYIPGSDSAAFKGITIFLGVMFSLGSSSIIANVVAGYTMVYRRAFRVGDRIKVEDIVGDVIEMRVLETHIRSLKNEEIVVPNNVILNSHVVNYTSLAQEKGLILHTTIGIGYDVPWRQVEAMLLMAADRTPDLLREPSPFVLETGLRDFSVRYELNVYCEQAAEMPRVYALLHQNILDVFNEYEISIMTPAYIFDTEDPKLVRKDNWFRSPAKQPPSLRQRVSKKK